MSIILSEELERIKQTMRDWWVVARDCRLDFLISLRPAYGTLDVPTYPANAR